MLLFSAFISTIMLLFLEINHDLVENVLTLNGIQQDKKPKPVFEEPLGKHNPIKEEPLGKIVNPEDETKIVTSQNDSLIKIEDQLLAQNQTSKEEKKYEFLVLDSFL